MPLLPPPETLKASLSQALIEFASENGEELANKIRDVAFKNLDHGRYHRFLLENGQASQLAYVRHIAACYEAQHPYVCQVQQIKSEEVWQPLYTKLQLWSYNYLLRCNFTPSRRTYETALDYAGWASESILQAHFPYDTTFDPWAHTLAINVCRNRIRVATQKSKIPDAMVVSLEALLFEPPTAPEFDRETIHMLRVELPSALETLTARRKSLINLHYFEGLSLPEIAKELDISLNAVHKLHFDALGALRKFLSPR